MRLFNLFALMAAVGCTVGAVLQARERAAPDWRHSDRPPTTKYFREAQWNAHYDARFGRKRLSRTEQQLNVKILMQTYLSTFSDLGIETWLMHGTLLGWWWGKQVLPWDNDADVQISEGSIFYLASYYNMTTWYFQYSRIPEGRTFLLDVNPNYEYREEADTLNTIDARWIDTETGLFIDITTARYNLTHPAGPGMLSCKDGHEYRDKYIFPLLDTTFEGVPAKIPYSFKALLEAEYSPLALTDTDYNGFKFVDSEMRWVPKEEPDQRSLSSES